MIQTLSLIALFGTMAVLTLISGAGLFYLLYLILHWLCGDLMERKKMIKESRKWEE